MRGDVGLSGLRLHPPNGVVGADDLGRVGVLRGQPEVHCGDRNAAGRQSRVHVPAVGRIVEEPPAPVNVQQAWEGPLALGLVDRRLKADSLVLQVNQAGCFDVEPG